VCVRVCIHECYKLLINTHNTYTHAHTHTHTHKACPRQVCNIRKTVTTPSWIQVKHISTQLSLDATCKLRDKCTVTGNKTKKTAHCYACPVTINSTHTASTPPQYDTQATSDLTVASFVTNTPAATHITSSVRKHNPQLSPVQCTVMEALQVLLHPPSYFTSIKWDFWRTHSFLNREFHTHPKVMLVSLSWEMLYICTDAF
jgi:hypothetical protein